MEAPPPLERIPVDNLGYPHHSYLSDCLCLYVREIAFLKTVFFAVKKIKLIFIVLGEHIV